jgi:hypothetical protein
MKGSYSGLAAGGEMKVSAELEIFQVIDVSSSL